MTNLERNFKILLMGFILGLISLSILIWFQTPDLFEYFNQAFCAH
ncbi:hypothetical protein [Acinetobacter courvalinii]|jgi:hypothetical protein|uniref:Uncharacterized protein n=1 Tax=Acinetobacter courvalinii TaxID=280147 RepID=N9RGE1_9GAMM|nr:hypothetical protein [Acinetobacter courvalinii]EKU56755.1 hypothetical protein ACINWC323_2602 [Acinetobacter sp. WC-323]EXB26261.1 hypothetical protein J537_2041 [Acinetobacter baumannii 1437282]EXB48497.1 hypothetical protein J522_0066 [Acinetobacter baumannii 146457]EYT22466.1 hypothetical protein J699_00842 [Acinetobacter sp. 1000160]ENX06462.1 hypothetical protein F898_03412 [Acinetobacter courvalinii]